MYKGNSPIKILTSTGCVRETPQINKNKIKKSQHGKCKRNSPQKSKSKMGCVRK